MNVTLLLPIFISLAVFLAVFGFELRPHSTPRSQRSASIEPMKKIKGVIGGFLSGTMLGVSSARRRAVAAVKASTLEESKEAARLVKKCIEGIDLMEKAAASGDYAEVARIMGSPEYRNFESAATILVRSDELTADEKVSLGTIKRYGVVADALIMLGGLGGELKSGGFKIAGDSGPAGIEEEEDDEDDEEGEKPKVNGAEVRKYLKLSKDALSDIDKITGKILQR